MKYQSGMASQYQSGLAMTVATAVGTSSGYDYYHWLCDAAIGSGSIAAVCSRGKVQRTLCVHWRNSGFFCQPFDTLVRR